MDENITRKHPIYKIKDKVKIINNTKKNKLEQSWKGRFEIIDLLDNNNIVIQNKEKILKIHIDQCLPYFSDDSEDDLPATSTNDR